MPGTLPGNAVPVEMAVRAWFNPNQESRLYYVPALIAVMLLVFSLLLTSIGIVKEKEIGTIEQVMVTPIRKMEFILGKTIPYIITGYISMTIMFYLAVVVFGVRIHGSVLLLYGLTGIYLCGNLGLALLVSASANTAAAGHSDRLLYHHALCPPQRVHVPRPQHAHGGAVRPGSTRCAGTWKSCAGWS